MEAIKFAAEVRGGETNAKILCAEGKIPAVLYGQGKKNLLLQFGYSQFETLFRQAGESTVVDLEIGKESDKALIHDIQKNPVTDRIIHVDFYRINLKEEVVAMIPLKFVGISPAIRDENCILITSREELEVKALPMNLPKLIEVDISILNEIGATIHLSDLKVPDGVTLTDDLEITIAQVAAPKMQELVEKAKDEDIEEESKPVEGESKDGEKVAEEGKKE